MDYHGRGRQKHEAEDFLRESEVQKQRTGCLGTPKQSVRKRQEYLFRRTLNLEEGQRLN